MPKTLLFLCTGNAIRSQMAEGFARKVFPDDWKIYSAGVLATAVHPQTIAMMREAGIDILDQYSKAIDEIPIDEVDYIVTLCGSAKESCPVLLKKIPSEHWPIDDPFTTGKNKVESFRKARDEIKKRVKELSRRLK